MYIYIYISMYVHVIHYINIRLIKPTASLSLHELFHNVSQPGHWIILATKSTGILELLVSSGTSSGSPDEAKKLCRPHMWGQNMMVYGNKMGTSWDTSAFSYPLVNSHIANWKDPPFSMGKSTRKITIFNSYVTNYQRVYDGLWSSIPSIPMGIPTSWSLARKNPSWIDDRAESTYQKKGHLEMDPQNHGTCAVRGKHQKIC